MKQICCKYVPRLIAPANAFDIEAPYLYRTTDGKVCSMEIQCCWKNTDDQYRDELELYAKGLHGCPFDTIKSIWLARLGSVSEYWYLVKLKEK